MFLDIYNTLHVYDKLKVHTFDMNVHIIVCSYILNSSSMCIFEQHEKECSNRIRNLLHIIVMYVLLIMVWEGSPVDLGTGLVGLYSGWSSG